MEPNQLPKQVFKTSDNSISMKIVIIAAITAVLVLLSFMIQIIVQERKDTRDKVFLEVSSKWGNPIAIAGPIISIPYKVFKDSTNKDYNLSYFHFMPEKLDIISKLHTQIRYRSIYNVPVYNSNILISGYFTKLDILQFGIDTNNIVWDKASINIGISELRGIKKQIKINLNGTYYDMYPGINSNISMNLTDAFSERYANAFTERGRRAGKFSQDDISGAGVFSNISIEPDRDIYFAVKMDINGSEEIYFYPVGKSTYTNISADWGNPSFDGSFLPDERNIWENGFEAKWTVLNLNRNYPESWIDQSFTLKDYNYGVKLLSPVDQYQMASRSIKYSILFIGLTFLLFFLSEIMNKLRIHPLQYILVGFALCLFYTLLISFSEHISFFWSYCIAAFGIIMLISVYSKTIFKSAKHAIFVGSVLLALFVFLYIILQLEDYALLFGSILLFVILAIVMYSTRKINWYQPLANGMD